jgi:hypothetical protein
MVATHLFDILNAHEIFRDLQELEICQRDGSASIYHPPTKKSRPDIIIVRRDRLPLLEEANSYWGSIEMAIGYCPAGKSREKCLEEVISYVGYLLEARPDLVSALGLLVEPGSFSFLLCNTDGIKKLTVSTAEDHFPLFLAVMKYLNGGQEKNLDATMSRESDPLLFNIAVPNGVASLGVPETERTIYKSCTLCRSHVPFGRRSSVFKYQPNNDVTAIRVIKDQYISKDHRWTEKDILDKIHASGTYPAVVRMCFAGTIPEAGCGDRIRVRIVLQDHGTDFLSLKTPRDVIYALYDLLEGRCSIASCGSVVISRYLVTRSLYFDRKILHRDISPWNIMIRDARDTEVIDTCSSSSPVFIRHLLDPQFVMSPCLWKTFH